MGAVPDKDKEEGEAYPPLVSITKILVMYQGFAPNRACFVHFVIVPSMSHRTISTC
jgi:hypothetical protein